MAKTKRPAFRKHDRVTLASHKSVIPAYDGKPFVLRDTVLAVSHLTGTGSTRNPWHVVVTDGTHFWHLEPDDVVPAETGGGGTVHSTIKKTGKQLDREIAESLTKSLQGGAGRPYQSKYGHGPADWQSGFDYAKESMQHETRPQMREAMRRLHEAASNDFDRGMLAAYQAALDVTPSKRSHVTIKKTKAARPTPYRLKLTPSELSAVAFARGRYAWPDMLAAHVAEDGSIAFTESEMWQWTDDVDSDMAGGHSPFPLAAKSFVEKLQRFYDSRV